MLKDRGAQIRKKKEENKKLQEQTQRMEQELQKVRKIKEIENQKLRLKKELEALNLESPFDKEPEKNQPKREEPQKLRDYGANIAKQNEIKAKKKIQKMKFMESSESQKEEQGDGQNVLYFLKVIGLESYFETLKNNKILSLPKIRNLKQTQMKAMNITVKDYVKMIKKLRQMGF